MQEQGVVTKLTKAPNEAAEFIQKLELIQNLLIHKSKFQKALDTISGKYRLREARIRLEKRHNERRHQEEQRYKLAFVIK